MEMRMLRLSIRLLCARSARLLGLATATAIAAATAASAAPLSSASLALTFASFPTLVFPGAGGTGTATSSLSASLGGSGVFNGALTSPVPTTAAPPLTHYGFVITKNGVGTLTGTTPGNVGGELSIQGTANVWGICSQPLPACKPLLSVPLNLGTPNTVFSGGGGVSVTAISAAWTAGTAVVTGLTLTNGTTATVMGSNGLTPGGQGTLVLVTPIKVLTNIAGALPLFGSLTLTYVPEPSTLVLVALGVTALAVAASRR
jgi:hypothetical protein